jgi:hypothetical protein
LFLVFFYGEFDILLQKELTPLNKVSLDLSSLADNIYKIVVVGDKFKQSFQVVKKR